jgi:hypothetical protein
MRIDMDGMFEMLICFLLFLPVDLSWSICQTPANAQVNTDPVDMLSNNQTFKP